MTCLFGWFYCLFALYSVVLCCASFPSSFEWALSICIESFSRDAKLEAYVQICFFCLWTDTLQIEIHTHTHTHSRHSTEIQIMFHINLLFAKFKINSQVRKMKWSAWKEKKIREKKRKEEERTRQEEKNGSSTSTTSEKYFVLLLLDEETVSFSVIVGENAVLVEFPFKRYIFT